MFDVATVLRETGSLAKEHGEADLDGNDDLTSSHLLQRMLAPARSHNSPAHPEENTGGAVAKPLENYRNLMAGLLQPPASR